MNLGMKQMGRTGAVTGGREENQTAAFGTGSCTQTTCGRRVFKTDSHWGWGRSRKSTDLHEFKSRFCCSLALSLGQDIKSHGPIPSYL